MANVEKIVYRIEYNDNEILSALKSACYRKDPTGEAWYDLCQQCPILCAPGCDLGQDEKGEDFKVYFTLIGYQEFMQQVFPRLEGLLGDMDSLLIQKICLINPKLAHSTTWYVSCWPVPELVLGN